MGNKSWVIFKGGKKLHHRKSGSGITHKQGKTERDRYDSTAARAETFDKNAHDAPKKASRTRPAAWGQTGGAK